ncbi:MAG: ribonuclease HII [Alphaproteobacteria bacterium]|nr:ribonuclease HII [Alphaproteobacteria bacterium]
MPTFNIERSHNRPVIGIDEAGRGPWAGPVVVAGVKFRTYDTLPDWVFQLNDSKKLSPKKRHDLFTKLQAANEYLSYHIETIDVAIIDHLNILEATMEGMRRCIQTLRMGNEDEVVLVDGNRTPVQEPWCYPIIKGDGISLSIAAASVLAKVYRDDLMAKLSIDYPQYRWETNAGYGTAHHQLALKTYGITPHHRKSFAPIRALSV